jgi:UDP-N-acetylglucosamine diphosphorylase/glucosamine-1-phosphate N-acetyltransferase
MPHAVVFDDRRAFEHDPLAPLTDLRASFDVRTGALTTLERLSIVLGAMADVSIVGVQAPDDIADLVRERDDGAAVNPTDLDALAAPAGETDEPAILLINGRCVVPPAELGGLEPGQIVLDAGDDDPVQRIVAAMLTPADAKAFLDGFAPPAGAAAMTAGEPLLMRRPWDVIRFRDDALDADLSILLNRQRAELPDGVIGIPNQAAFDDETGDFDEDAEDGLWMSPDATVWPTAVLDASQGPIVIEAGATVRPRAIIQGPAFIGASSTVLDGAIVKQHCAIGPVCKVAGELGGVIIQGHSNKGHDGHLGDAWLGEWVNLGAATVNSNLLNTYSEITAVPRPGASRERTGMQFLGCILGDHTKTAIGTRIMTGAIAHTGVMWAAGAAMTGCLAPMTWITDAGAKPYRMTKFMEAAEAMMARRGVEPSAAYRARLNALADA